MAESTENRNLPATERKLGKAREEGNLPRSTDVVHFTVLTTCVAACYALGTDLIVWLRETLSQGLRFDIKLLQQPELMSSWLWALVQRMLWVIIPAGLGCMGVSIASTLMVGGWNWTLKKIGPNFSVLNPLTGLVRILSKQGILLALKACVLAILLATIAAFYIKSRMSEFNRSWGMDLNAGIIHVAGLILGGVLLLLLLIFLFALIDVPLQKYLYASQLKMSFQEVKQEHKETEGSAEVKSKVRARMREMAGRRMLAAVPKADLVVMNPTHYAVALHYDEKSMGAPRVVAKGADLLALRIRDVAKTSKVPVLQAPVLARALYTHAALDREIPVALFSAVAQVLAYVYQMRAAINGQAPMPSEVPIPRVPPELDPHHRKTQEDPPKGPPHNH